MNETELKPHQQVLKQVSDDIENLIVKMHTHQRSAHLMAAIVDLLGAMGDKLEVQYLQNDDPDVDVEYQATLTMLRDVHGEALARFDQLLKLECVPGRTLN